MPLQIAQFTGPQTVPKGDQYHGRVAMTVAARFASCSHQGFDLGGGKIFPRSRNWGIYDGRCSALGHLETVIRDILDGQYNDPACVVAFNVAEGWAREVTGDVAREVLKRAISENKSLPGTVRDLLNARQVKRLNCPA